MEREEACAVGDQGLEGRALTALADMALMREADPPRARELADQALAVLDRSDARPLRRFRVGWNSSVLGRPPDRGRPLPDRRPRCGTRSHGRRTSRGLQVIARASTYQAKLELDEAKAQLAVARELAEESGDHEPRPGSPQLDAHLSPRASGAGRGGRRGSAERLFSEAGAVWAVARALNLGAWAAWWSATW